MLRLLLSLTGSLEPERNASLYTFCSKTYLSYWTLENRYRRMRNVIIDASELPTGFSNEISFVHSHSFYRTRYEYLFGVKTRRYIMHSSVVEMDNDRDLHRIQVLSWQGLD